MNSRRLLAYIFLFLSICLRQSLGQVFPIDQPYDIDSLQRVLRVAKSDTNKVWTFLCLSETYRNVDIGKSLAAAESARVLAGRLETNRGSHFRFGKPVKWK